MNFKYNATGDYEIKENFTDMNLENEYVIENIPCINNGQRIDIIDESFDFPCVDIKFYMKKSIYEKISKISKNINIINKKLKGKEINKLLGSDKLIYNNLVNLLNEYEILVSDIIYSRDLETKNSENEYEVDKMKNIIIKMKEQRVNKINKKIDFIEYEIQEKNTELQYIIEEEKKLNFEYKLLKEKPEKFSSLRHFSLPKEFLEKYKTDNNLPILKKLNLIEKKLKILLNRKKDVKNLIKELERQKNQEKEYIKLIKEQLKENLAHLKNQHKANIKLNEDHDSNDKEVEQKNNDDEKEEINKRYDDINKLEAKYNNYIETYLKKNIFNENSKNKINIKDYSYIIVSFTFILTILSLIIYYGIYAKK